MKKILLVLTLALCASMTFAQTVPTYVPTDGLVGYWPFNGNANDESGNGNNGTVNGATLADDRFGNSNGAFSFDGLNDYINIPNSNSLNFGSNLNFSVSFFYQPVNQNSFSGLISKMYPSRSSVGPRVGWQIIQENSNIGFQSRSGNSLNEFENNPCGEGQLTPISPNKFNHCVIVFDRVNGKIKFYVDNVLIRTNSCVEIIENVSNVEPLLIGVEREGWFYSSGKIDDIAIYNRALTQEEITNLYYAENSCQSLVINTGVLSFNPPTYNNTVTIYPNPANDHITIDCGNLANVSGWSIKIFNTLGQEVFSGAMNTQQYVVPLNTWSGQGVYFVKIYDASNNLMNTKKIILQ